MNAKYILILKKIYLKILFFHISQQNFVQECTAAMQIVFDKTNRCLFKSISYHQVISNNSLTFDMSDVKNYFCKYF